MTELSYRCRKHHDKTVVTSVTGEMRTAEYIVISRPMSVCLFVRSRNSKTTRQNFTVFLSLLPVAVARSSSDGVAIRYVLPVLWMTFCFHTMASLRVMRIPKRRLNTTIVTGEIPTQFFHRQKLEV